MIAALALFCGIGTLLAVAVAWRIATPGSQVRADDLSSDWPPSLYRDGPRFPDEHELFHVRGGTE